MKPISISLLAVAVLAAFAPFAQAQLILNGNFEDGFADWTLYGNQSGTYTTPTPYSPTGFEAQFGPVGSLEYITQSFETTAGDEYQVSFDFAGPNGGYQEFDALFGDTSITLPNAFSLSSYSGLTDLFTLGGPNAVTAGYFNLPDATVNTWQNDSFDVEATSSSSQLLFADRQDQSYNYLTDVAVTDLGPSNSFSGAPEPSSYGWFGVAALLSTIAWRRLGLGRAAG